MVLKDGNFEMLGSGNKVNFCRIYDCLDFNSSDEDEVAKLLLDRGAKISRFVEVIRNKDEAGFFIHSNEHSVLTTYMKIT